MNDEEKLKQLSQYNILNFLEIVSTPASNLQVINYKLKLVPTPTGIILAAEADSSNENKPALPPDKFLKLTFILQIRNSEFFNYSDLDLKIPRDRIFYFNNLDKEDSDKLSLSKSAPSGNPSLKYVGDNDLIKVYNNLHNYPLQTSGANTLFTISDLNDKIVFQDRVQHEPETFQLDLRQFSSGFYTLTELENANSFSEQFYLNNNLFQPGIFGLVEIFGKSTQQNTYAILTPAGQFKSSPPSYTLRIKNRSTHWRYIFKKDQVVGTGSNVVFKKKEDGVTDNKKILVTADNQPLTKNGLIEVKKGNEKKDKLPNPDTRMIKPDPNDANKIYSEIYS